MAQLSGKTITPRNVRCTGGYSINGILHPCVTFQWRRKTYSFTCVKELGQYLSVDMNGVIDKQFSIQSTAVEDLFQSAITYHPTIR